MYPGIANCPNSQDCASDPGKNRNVGMVYISIAQSRIIGQVFLILVFCFHSFPLMLKKEGRERKQTQREWEKRTVKREKEDSISQLWHLGWHQKNKSRPWYSLDPLSTNDKDPRWLDCSMFTSPKRSNEWKYRWLRQSRKATVKPELTWSIRKGVWSEEEGSGLKACLTRIPRPSVMVLFVITLLWNQTDPISSLNALADVLIYSNALFSPCTHSLHS